MRGACRQFLPIIDKINGEVWNEKRPTRPEVSGKLTADGGSGTVSGHEKLFVKIGKTYK
jgi:hypothetical protein